MAKKNMVSPNRQQPPMAKNMESTEQDMDEIMDEAKREANAAYAPYFNEYNWLRAISPNLVVRIKE